MGEQHFDLAIVNGDLARLTGEPADYAQFASLMKPVFDKTPTLLTMGNHDGREHAQAALTWDGGTVQPVAEEMGHHGGRRAGQPGFPRFAAGDERHSRTTRKSAASLACQLSRRERREEPGCLRPPRSGSRDDNALVDAEALLEDSSPPPRL